MNDTNDQRTTIRLRFLAEAAIELLSGATGETYASESPLAGEISEDVLRTMLSHAAPVLRATAHQDLADQIEQALAEPTGQA